MTTNLQECVVEVEDVLSLASESFDIWRTLTDANIHPGYESTLLAYETFFQATIRAHFLTLVVCSYSLYDTTRGTHTIARLLDRLNSEQVGAQLIADLREKIKEVSVTWEKIKILRHNVFAHRSANSSPESCFSEAKLTPDELGNFILENKRILSHIAVKAGMQPIFEEAASPAEQTQNVMRSLEQRLS